LKCIVVPYREDMLCAAKKITHPKIEGREGERGAYKGASASRMVKRIEEKEDREKPGSYETVGARMGEAKGGKNVK